MTEPSVPARREGASADQAVTPSALVKELEWAIRDRLDPVGDSDQALLSDGVQPLLDTVRTVRKQLFPEEGETPELPPKREKVLETLTAALDDMEDVLEALLLKRPGAHPFSRGVEG